MHTNNCLNGVYAIHCKVNDFIYVGSAAGRRGFRGRLWNHLHHLRKGTHHSRVLQGHYKKYGEDAFEFHILEFCSPAECLQREQGWIDIRGVGYENKSYNTGPVAGSQLGCKRSPESCKRIGRVHIGHKRRVGAIVSEETRAKLRAGRLGKKHTPEAIAKISAASKLQVHSPERRANQSIKSRGRKCKESAKQKIAEANSLDFIVTTPDGVEVAVRNMAAFCRQHGLTKTQMVNAAKGRCIGHKGYRCRYAHETREEQEAKIQAVRASQTIKEYLVTSPTGEEFKTENLTAFCQQHQLGTSAMSAIARGERRIYKGWTCRLVNEPDEVRQCRLSLRGRFKTYIATLPDGTEVVVDDLPQFCAEHKLDTSGMTKVAKGKRSHYKGFQLRYAEPPADSANTLDTEYPTH
ncbi:GIY-YIG nuclease family protein [Trichocoleus desertorum AS-A10]|uniref:GIY-YIG nuclease family protein n=1 Tax=Trichocoleus desertorum TaxID=1481672 RepID=UPI0032970A5F